MSLRHRGLGSPSCWPPAADGELPGRELELSDAHLCLGDLALEMDLAPQAVLDECDALLPSPSSSAHLAAGTKPAIACGSGCHAISRVARGCWQRCMLSPAWRLLKSASQLILPGHGTSLLRVRCLTSHRCSLTRGRRDNASAAKAFTAAIAFLGILPMSIVTIRVVSIFSRCSRLCRSRGACEGG